MINRRASNPHSHSVSPFLTISLSISITITISVLLSSCGFPGSLIRYNKETSISTQDSITVTNRSSDYVCLDYDKNFECQRYRVVYRDTLTNQVVRIESVKGTQLSMNGGRTKVKVKIRDFDQDGDISLKSNAHRQSYGRFGRERHFREVEFLPNGQKKVTVRKGTLRNPHKLERVRLVGNKFRRRDD